MHPGHPRPATRPPGQGREPGPGGGPAPAVEAARRGGPALVAVGLPPGPGFVAALDAAWTAGHDVAPVDPDLPEPALGALLDELRPARLVTTAGERTLPDGEPVAPGAALVVATSGSTGRPKGAVLTHAALSSSVQASLARIGGAAGDRWLCCLPLHHVAGIAVVLRARALGGQAVIHPRFDPSRVAAEPAVTHVSLVPTQLGRLLDAGVDVGRFAAILLGGAPAPADLLARAAHAGARVVTTYGMTETCGGCVYDGAPLDGVEVAAGADGRVRIRGPVVFAGYRRRPDLTAAAMDNGWLVTDDLGHWERGRLMIDGRVDDVIVSGGENVPAAAVAAALREHPAVADAAVGGVPDPQWGQAVTAWVVAAGVHRPELDELRQVVASRLGPRAAPRAVRWVSALPRTGLGKVAADALSRTGDDGGEEPSR